MRAVGHGGLAVELAKFWPANGPTWDALAVVVRPSSPTGVLLVEAKAHPDKLLKGSPAGATAPASLATIEAAVAATCDWLGATPTPAWTRALFQMTNRLAHLYWLRQVVGIDAWLAHVLFVGDHTHRPTSHEEWKTALADAYAQLGVGTSAHEFAATVFLPAYARDELVRQR